MMHSLFLFIRIQLTSYQMSKRLQALALHLHPIADDNSINKSELYNTIFPSHFRAYFAEVFNLIEKNHHLFLVDADNAQRREKRESGIFQTLKILEQIKIDLVNEPEKFSACFYAFSHLNIGIAVKGLVQYLLYIKTLVTFGHNKKHKEFVNQAINCKELGCFALTQFHHGSFSRGIKTQAFYEHGTKSFRITTNGKEGMKFWIGNMAETANFGVVWAELIVKEVSYGIHAFVVQFRSKQNHKLLDGVLIGDVGPKNGIDLMDNGYLILDNVKVPSENLLGKLGYVDENGEYRTKVKNNEQRFGLHMSPLSSGRALLGPCTLAQSMIALKISLSYVHHRRQFSSDNNTTQNLLINYQLTKSRLLVPLAKNVVFYFGQFNIVDLYNKNRNNFIDPSKKIVQQLHALSAVTKAKVSWFSSATIDECRQMLGGHGYSSYSQLGRLYQDNDVNLTWEGDNNLLLQQTSKFLLKFIPSNKTGEIIDLRFLNKGLEKPKLNIPQFLNIQNLELIIKQMLLWRYEESIQEIKRLKEQRNNDFWNELQPYFCNNLALAFSDYYFFNNAKNKINAENMSQNNRKFLHLCLQIYVCDLILEHKFGKLQFRTQVEKTELELLNQLQPNCMDCVDTLCGPHFLIRSPLLENGMSEYIQKIWTEKGTFKRVEWFEKLIKWRQSMK